MAPKNLTCEPSASFQAIEDIVANMRRLESERYNISLIPLSPASPQQIDPSWRQAIVTWMYGVVDACHLQREAVSAAAYFLDVCVSKGIVQSRSDYQLVAMTSLQLALKLFGNTLVQLESMVKLGRGFFNTEDVVAMEKRILNALNWQVHPPTPECFLEQFVLLLPQQQYPYNEEIIEMIKSMTRELIKIAVCSNDFKHFKPSTIAYSGMLVAMDRISEYDLPISHRHCFVFQMTHMVKMDHKQNDIALAVEMLRDAVECDARLQQVICMIESRAHNAKQQEYSFSSTTSAVESPRQTNCI